MSWIRIRVWVWIPDQGLSLSLDLGMGLGPDPDPSWDFHLPLSLKLLNTPTEPSKNHPLTALKTPTRSLLFDSERPSGTNTTLDERLSTNSPNDRRLTFGWFSVTMFGPILRLAVAAASASFRLFARSL